LSHTLLPFVNRDEAWLSEGLATYYQYVLMGRDGRLSEQEAWQRIYNGFRKGMHDSRGETLAEASENMHEEHAFKNVYWSGAAMMLRADVLLREKGSGSYSLDSALRTIHDHDLWYNRMWNAEELLQELDSYSETNVFINVYNTYINSGEFPVDDAYWEKLGVINNNGSITLSDEAPLATIRKQIIPPGRQ